jgi:hypothetical protein
LTVQPIEIMSFMKRDVSVCFVICPHAICAHSAITNNLNDGAQAGQHAERRRDEHLELT